MIRTPPLRNTTMDPTADALRAALAERFGETIDLPEALAGHPGLAELLRMATRTSHRDWADTPVDPGLVRLLAACAFGAPSKSFLQQADIIDVRDPALRREVEALVPSMPWMARAPALLVFVGNGRRFRRLFQRRGAAFANEHLDGFFNPVVDASLVLASFVRAAEAIGLACCPISVLRDRATDLARLLALPDHTVPIAGLCVGHPRAARTPLPRLPLRATLHVDRFDDRATDEAVDEFDRRYAAVRSAATGAPSAAWSDERTRQYATAQRADWGAFVRSKGFDPT